MVHQGTVRRGRRLRALIASGLALAVLATVGGCADDLVIPVRQRVPADARVPSGDQPNIYSTADRDTPLKTQKEVDEDIRDLEALRETVKQP